jgi:uncharacterized protein
MSSRTLRASRYQLGWLCCALLSVQCGTPRPREHYAAAPPGDAGRMDAAAGATRDAEVSDSGPRPPADAGSPQDAASPDAASDAASAGDAGSRDAGADDDSSDPSQALVLEACGEPPVSDASFSRQALREAAGRCAVYHYCGFKATDDALRKAADDYAAAPDDTQLKAARAAFRSAMRRWSRAELFQFGPASSANMSAGRDIYQGKGLRDRIYAWPAIARCRVEEALAADKPDPASALISARGLFAIEYSLYFTGEGSDCAASSPATKLFAQLSADELKQRKASYAASVAADVSVQTQALLDAWSPSGADFAQQFSDAAGYPSEQEAMNVLGWALIYVEREVKDWKLGIPAGYTMTAPVNLAESSYAPIGTELLRENLRGFRALYQGCGENGEGLGFDDWLEDAGHGELANDIVAAYTRAQASFDALPPLREASKAQLDASYQTLRELTTLLKADLFGAGSPLGLKLPAGVEGDTD